MIYLNEIYEKVERRGFVWQCANGSHKNRKYRGTTHDSDKEPCGQFNVYFGRKWMPSKKASRWTAKCLHCGRRKQLNLGCVLPENPDYFESRDDAKALAKKMNFEKKKKEQQAEDWF